MTPKELSEVMNRLEKYYKSFYQGVDKKEVFAAWFEMFKDDQATEVQKAAVAYICTQIYPPTVAGLKTIMAENRMAGQMAEMEAWGRIRKAIDDASGRNEAYEAFSKLPPILKKIVYNPSQLRAWHACSEDTLEGVIASNVQRSYRELAKREAVYYAIPGQLQQEQTWRVEAPKVQIALPEVQKTISQVVEDANVKAAEHGMVMTDDLREKHASRLDSFIKPMTAEEIKLVEDREDARGKRFLR